jgi:hypothetical protein
MADGQSDNMQCYPVDQPLPYETDLWTPGPSNEIRRVVLKRHSPYYVNLAFVDFSVRRATIKEVWKLHWAKNWPTSYPLPVWPKWMTDVPDPL